jgi:quercetin dioxygenase-like cupin family protein
MSDIDAPSGESSSMSEVWSNLVGDVATPGFTLRTTYPTNPDGVDVMLERWDAGTDEPPHSHPGDDMTIVVEGQMSTQRYRRDGDSLVPDGARIILHKGDVGYTRAHRIHDAQYIDNCELVYVHNGAFAFTREEGDVK